MKNSLKLVLSLVCTLAAPLASTGAEKPLRINPRAFPEAKIGQPLTENDENRLADAIWVVEGGAKTTHPYGVLTKFKTTTPRQACINTVRHKHSDWIKAGCHGDFMDYLADRYCPSSADPVGNVNWKANVHKLMK